MGSQTTRPCGHDWDCDCPEGLRAVIAERDEAIRILRSAFDAVQASEDISEEAADEMEGENVRLCVRVSEMEVEWREWQALYGRCREQRDVTRDIVEKQDVNLDTLRAIVEELEEERDHAIKRLNEVKDDRDKYRAQVSGMEEAVRDAVILELMTLWARLKDGDDRDAVVSARESILRALEGAE